MATEFSVIGKSTPQLDNAKKVTGEALYTADLRIPGTLQGRILRSPYPHANILSIDTSRAEALPGVKAVVTAEDGPKRKYAQLPQYADEHIPAWKKVRHVGEAVAAVAAIDLDIAEEALDLIRVEYEPLPAVFDPFDALAPGAPLLHDHAPGNVSVESNWHFGDVDKGFAEAYYIREDKFDMQPCTHSPMEPHTVLADWVGGGRLTLHASTQGSAVLRHNISWALGIPEGDVRVIPPFVGGGFGGKMELYAHDVCAALLSRKAGRPVIIALTREEVLCATREKHPMYYWVRTGVKKDGTITAREADLVGDGGAYQSIGPLTMFLFGSFMQLPYKVANFRYHYRRVYTNKTARGALRGHGIPQANFGSEVNLSRIAEDIGMDPVELRRRNAITAPYTAPNGFVIKSAGLLESIDKATETVNWYEKRGRRDGKRGIGLACNSFLSGNNFSPNLLATVVIKIDYGAGITLLTGATEIGQGSKTTLAMIAAEELGIRPEDISVLGGDTDLTPPDAGAYSSRTTMSVGKASQLAAIEVKKQIFDVVAKTLECKPEDLEARDRRIYVKGSPDRGLSWRDAIKACFKANVLPIVAKGSNQLVSTPPNWLGGTGNMSPAYTFAAQVVEVDVNRQTGEVKIDTVSACHDCGRAINPIAAEGQVHGSLINALSMAMLEDLPRDNGSNLHSTFLTYRLPTSVDTPSIQAKMVETNDPYGPFGAKESGESLQVPTAAAAADAIHDALGIWITSLPITAEKVLAALDAKEREGK